MVIPSVSTSVNGGECSGVLLRCTTRTNPPEANEKNEGNSTRNGQWEKDHPGLILAMRVKEGREGGEVDGIPMTIHNSSTVLRMVLMEATALHGQESV
ncbi:uncharacterized [Tachysurus ichikawai]